MSKRLTVLDLLKEKEKYQIKQDVTEEVYVERLDADVVIRKPEKSLCTEVLSMSRDEDTTDDADVYMVYNTLVEPNLKDSELQKAYGCVEPTEIVEKIFEPGEIAQLSQVALELAGYEKGTVRLVKDLKN